MSKFSAEEFCKICSRLSGMAETYLRLASPFPQPQDYVDPSDIPSLAEKLRKIAATCETIGLRVTSLQIDAAIAGPLSRPVLSPIQCSQILTDLGVALTCEMSAQLFLWVSPEKASYYEKSGLFGPNVEKAFPSAARDIKSAGSCYACERDTACVMHLMRVLEVGLNSLATSLQVAFDRRNWENVINDIEASVAKINGPHAGADWKARQRVLSDIAKDFRYFKNAWRNHAMHYRESYDAPEAHLILEHVKTFMDQLAENGIVE